MEIIALYSIIVFMLLFVLLMLWAVASTTSSPTYKEMMDWDFHACEQMRESGWSEDEIQEFMNENNGYYDKDYNT